MTNSLTDSQASALIEATSVSIFNERDPKKRRELMTQHWSEQITCFSPFGANQGFDSIDQVWEGLHANDQSAWVFKKTGDKWVNANVVMQAWTFGLEEGEPGMKGWDVLIVDKAGKVESLYAMIEGMSTRKW